MLVLAGFALNLFLFFMALRDKFTRPNGKPLLVCVLVGCGVVCAIVDFSLIALSRPPLFLSLVSLLFLGLSQLIFYAAIRATAEQRLSLAFSADLPVHLNQSGIFNHIRHPFYLSYLLTWLAAATIVTGWPALFALLMMTAFYLIAAIREERKFSASPLAAAYRHYQNQTGMFFPRISFTGRDLSRSAPNNEELEKSSPGYIGKEKATLRTVANWGIVASIILVIVLPFYASCHKSKLSYTPEPKQQSNHR